MLFDLSEMLVSGMLSAQFSPYKSGDYEDLFGESSKRFAIVCSGCGQINNTGFLYVT